MQVTLMSPVLRLDEGSHYYYGPVPGDGMGRDAGIRGWCCTGPIKSMFGGKLPQAIQFGACNEEPAARPVGAFWNQSYIEAHLNHEPTYTMIALRFWLERALNEGFRWFWVEAP